MDQVRVLSPDDEALLRRHSESKRAATSEQLRCQDASGRDLFAFIVDDGGRHWVWAHDEADAVRIVAETHCGSIEAYEADIGPISMADVWPMTSEDGKRAQFVDENGIRMSMLRHFQRIAARGLMATSEY